MGDSHQDEQPPQEHAHGNSDDQAANDVPPRIRFVIAQAALDDVELVQRVALPHVCESFRKQEKQQPEDAETGVKSNDSDRNVHTNSIGGKSMPDHRLCFKPHSQAGDKQNHGNHEKCGHDDDCVPGYYFWTLSAIVGTIFGDHEGVSYL